MTSIALELYFDGRCALCTAQMQRFARWDTEGRLAFVDIAAVGFDPAPLGVGLAALNREIHARTADGRVLAGIDSLIAACTAVGRGWAVWPLRVPGVRAACAAGYRVLARNRYALSSRFGGRPAPACDDGACPIGNPFLSSGQGAAASANPAPASPSAAISSARPPRHALRRWLVLWLYAAAVAHLAVGVLLPLLAAHPVLAPYHAAIERQFWGGAQVPASARAQQLWWLALFGATVQCAGVWMLALVHLGNRLRQRAIWGWLLAGLLLWAPQDIATSWRAGVMVNVAIDAVALLLLVPPLAWLWKADRA